MQEDVKLIIREMIVRVHCDDYVKESDRNEESNRCYY